MKNFCKKIIKKIFNALGLDIIRINKNPHYSFLGLKELPIRTIIDVGANEGQFARKIIKVFPDARIYCFEPLIDPYNKLRDWADKQNGKISVFNNNGRVFIDAVFVK